MDWRLRWAIGVVAAIGAVAIGNAAITAVDMLPNGSGPLYGAAAVMAVIAGLCFWPWGNKHAANASTNMAGYGQSKFRSFEVTPEKVTDAHWEKSPATRVRYVAVGMLLSGLVFALLPFFGLAPDRMEDAPPIVIHLGGLAIMTIGAVAMSFSFTHRGAAAGVLLAKVLLWSIIILMVLVPLVAIAAALLGY